MKHILTPDGELYHYGVKGMKWGVKKTPDVRIGQNYKISPVSSGGGIIDDEAEDIEDNEIEDNEIDDVLDTVERYMEAGKLWVSNRLSTRVIDTITKNQQSISWKDAKEAINYKYRYTNKRPLK